MGNYIINENKFENHECENGLVHESLIILFFLPLVMYTKTERVCARKSCLHLKLTQKHFYYFLFIPTTKKTTFDFQLYLFYVSCADCERITERESESVPYGRTAQKLFTFSLCPRRHSRRAKVKKITSQLFSWVKQIFTVPHKPSTITNDYYGINCCERIKMRGSRKHSH
jgi:hypothetical protein